MKQASTQAVLAGQLTFPAGGGSPTMAPLFGNPESRLGLASLSDIPTLSPVAALIGTAAADNLLVLSRDSRRLVAIDRSGLVLSSLDPSGLTAQAIEGGTVDEKDVLYLVAEDSGTANSRLFVLSSPVPEPASLALMLAGIAPVGVFARRRG